MKLLRFLCASSEASCEKIACHKTTGGEFDYCKFYICNVVHVICLNDLNAFVLAMTTTSSIVF